MYEALAIAITLAMKGVCTVADLNRIRFEVKACSYSYGKELRNGRLELLVLTCR